MKNKDVFEKLVSLLGRSENDPEVIAVLTELGVKLPLKRPPSYVNYWLFEDKERKFYLSFEYAESWWSTKDNKEFKEKEMIFTGIQDLNFDEKFRDVIFPFGIYFGMTKEEAIANLGEYFIDIKHNNGSELGWRKSGIFVGIEFNDDDTANSIGIRLLFEDELE